MNERFKPQYLPHNDDAHALVKALALELGLSLKGHNGSQAQDDPSFILTLCAGSWSERLP